MLVLVNWVKNDKIDGNKYKSIRKSENKIVKILAKSKSWNISKFENLSKFKNFVKV